MELLSLGTETQVRGDAEIGDWVCDLYLDSDSSALLASPNGCR